jgi:NAD(P)-dependent dehydrogenase (short-subunit alcohol dehydrogenase family)
MLRYTDEDYAAVTDVNLRGTFNVMRAAGRIMYQQRSGAIIVISSISSRVVEPGQVIYAGTKAALAAMVRVLAAELGPYGVRVNALAPGPVETELTIPIRDDPAWQDAYASKVAVKRWGQPTEIAAPAVFLASDEASFVNGAQLFADGGWTDLDQRYQGGPVGDF